jgi:uncharacterized protein YmfQ (DUF2313 family)
MPDDQHVTRSGEDYAEALQALLPQGPAWPRDYNSTLMTVVRGLTEIWGDFEMAASLLLERESDPRITFPPQGPQSGLLPDWERNWGLPDPCYDDHHRRGVTRVLHRAGGRAGLRDHHHRIPPIHHRHGPVR